MAELSESDGRHARVGGAAGASGKQDPLRSSHPANWLIGLAMITPSLGRRRSTGGRHRAGRGSSRGA